MEELRAGWEVPSIAHYCEIFRKPFRLPEFDVEELEEAFIASGSPDGSILLTQIYIQLLKGCYPHRGIGEGSYIKCLKNVYKHNVGEDNEFSDVNSAEAFYMVPQKVKVELLYMLCHIRLNSADVIDLLKGYDGDYLRLDPIGTDCNGAVYWYFDDIRLYKEDRTPPKRTPAKKKVTGKKTSKKCTTSAKKTNDQSNAKQRSQRQSRSLGNIADSKGNNSIKPAKEVTTPLRTRSVHNLRATRGRGASDKQNDSSDVSPPRKCIKTDSISPEGSKKSEPSGKHVDTNEKDSMGDGSTPRRSSRTRSATSWYQYEEEKLKNEKPAQSSSDTDDDSVTLAQITANIEVSDSGSGRWHLVCVKIEDWVALAETFHKSSVACERKLSRRLTNDIIPLAQARCDQKEKLRRKKLLEVAPRRTSGRLEVKRHLQEEEFSRWEQRVSNSSSPSDWNRRRRHEDELNWTSEEMKQKEKEEREKEREKARQERLRRVELRELRASLLAQGKFVPPELFGMPQREPSSDSDDTSHEELMNMMGRVLSQVRQRRDAWPFRHPVDEQVAPDYQTLIEHPMDLETMDQKLKTGMYTNKEQFAKDFNLIFENCCKYNGPNSDYTVLANKLEKFVKRIMEKYLPDEAESSSSVDEDSDSGSDSSSDSDYDRHNKDLERGRNFQPIKYVPSQNWTSSLCRSSLSTAAAPSLTLPRRPCYATSYSSRKTNLPQGASTIITIRRIPDSTPPSKFYPSHNTSPTEQQRVVRGLPGNLAGNLAGIAAEHGPGKYQIVAVPADGFITDVACMSLPTTSTQNSVVSNNHDTNQHKLVKKNVAMPDGGVKVSRTLEPVVTAVKIAPKQAVSVQPVSLSTHGLTSTTQTVLMMSPSQSITSHVGARGHVTIVTTKQVNSVGKQTGDVSLVGGQQGGQRVVVTSVRRPASITSESHLSAVTRVLTNSCQSPVQRTPYVLPRPPVVPGQPPKLLADQPKCLVNGQVTGSPRVTVVTNGQSHSKLLDESVVPRIQCVKPNSEKTTTLSNTSSCVVTPVASLGSTAVSSSSS